MKPSGQLVLTEKELAEEFTRILNANNPHAPQNISKYSHKEKIFKTVANMEHCSFHFEFDGYRVWVWFRYLVYNENDEEVSPVTEDQKDIAVKPVGEDEGITIDTGVGTSTEESKPKQPLKNQFNYSERASQSVNNPSRSRSTNTDPPPQRSFSANVSQWSIYDDYTEDLQAKEKLKEKDKSKSGNLKARMKKKPFLS